MSEIASGPAATYPHVTVVTVAHNPGAWFDEVLGSLVSQDYPAFDVIVIDGASDVAVAPRVHAVLPNATVIPLSENVGFASAANMMLGRTGPGRHLLICHDDVALAPDCIRRLMEESLRSNAGVVGPKLLAWSDPNRILHVGLGADKTGVVSELADPGEYDQEQHDAVRDVFAVPGAVTLIRADLFEALQGFDGVMRVQGEDLDLCWRAHVLGARVLVNPSATARHREDIGTRLVGHDREAIRRRHRIRSMLCNYGLAHTVRVVPQAVAASLVNIAIALARGQVKSVIEIVSAWMWNLGRLGQVLHRRRLLRRTRRVRDSEVRALQIPGFEGLQSWRRARADRRSAERYDADRAALEHNGIDRRHWFRVAVAVWCSAGVFLIFGSRNLILDRIPVFNQMSQFPQGPGPLLREWSTTWRGTGIGTEAPSHLLQFVLGFAGVALFGQMGLLKLIVTLGMILVGAIGVHRLLAPFRSLPAQLVGLVIYLVNPLPYNAIHRGSWSGLVLFGVMPWVARRLAIASGLRPFPGADSSWIRRLGDMAATGLLVASAALVEPLVAACVLVMVLGWAFGSLAAARPAGIGRLFLSAAVALVCAFVLLVPGSLAVFSAGREWSIFGSSSPTSGDQMGLGQVLRFAAGPHGDTLLGWAILVVPALALLVALGDRLAWAARGWFVTVISWGVVWAAQKGVLPVSSGDPTVMLAPASLGLAFAGAMMSVAFGLDVRRFSFGWRQMVPFAAWATLAVAVAAGSGAIFDGRWGSVEQGYDRALGFIDQKSPAHSRILWIGEQDVLPVAAWRFDDRLSFSITHARTPSIVDRPFGNPDPHAVTVKNLVVDMLADSSSRFGQQIGPYGIRYIALVEANAPAPFATLERPIAERVLERFGEQLDLVTIEMRDGITLFENSSHIPVVAAFDKGTVSQVGAEEPSAIFSHGFELALPQVRSLTNYSGELGPSEVYFATASSPNWSLETNSGPTIRSRGLGWANVFLVDDAQLATLKHRDVYQYAIAAVAQAVLWGLVLVTLTMGRRRADR